MKNILITLGALITWNAALAQHTVTVQMDKPVEGICNNEAVYSLYSGFMGQTEPACPVSDEELLKRLNNLPFLKAHPRFRCKGMIGFYINCEGEMLECAFDGKNSTGNEELDRQIIEVFRETGAWSPGAVEDKAVDSRVLYSFQIKKGVVTF